MANKEQAAEVRLNKYLSEAGICSRREADRLIEAGKVTVDGVKAVTGMKVLPTQNIQVGKKPVVQKKEKPVLLAVNKPVGVVCTTEKKERRNIVDYIGYPTRIYPVGRLDKDSEGLILMTNNGDIVNRMMRSSNYHEKEYLVTVNKPITDVFIRQMREGVRIKKEEDGEVILDETTRPCKMERMGKCKFRITLTQGLNRQIRRMCEALGYQVTELKRIRIMNIEIGGLKPGDYRRISEKEIKELYEMLKESKN